MTNRERILAILDGRPPDRIPWFPRLRIWYDANRLAGTLPERYREMAFRDVERDVFGGVSARHAIIYTSQLRGVEVRTRKIDELETLTEYVTPVGTVTTRLRATQRLRQQGIQDSEVDFVLKRREDYAVVEYLTEHTEYTAAYEQYEEYEQGVGEDGYPMVNCGDCPFHHWMRALVGYDRGYYHLQDYTKQVEHLLGVLSDCYRERLWPHLLDSPARLVMHVAALMFSGTLLVLGLLGYGRAARWAWAPLLLMAVLGGGGLLGALLVVLVVLAINDGRAASLWGRPTGASAARRIDRRAARPLTAVASSPRAWTSSGITMAAAGPIRARAQAALARTRSSSSPSAMPSAGTTSCASGPILPMARAALDRTSAWAEPRSCAHSSADRPS